MQEVGFTAALPRSIQLSILTGWKLVLMTVHRQSFVREIIATSFPGMQVTSTATIVLSSTGLVMVRIHKREPETLAEARETLAAAISAAAGRRSPLLLDMQAAPPLAMEVRRLYLNQGLSEHFSALALLVEDSVLGRMMGNVYAALVRTGLPSNVFTNESGAREWLIQYTV